MCIYDKHTNLSNSHIGLAKGNSNNGKPVKCTITGKVFNSITDATKYYDLQRTGISDCLSGKCKTCGIDQ